ncbi:MAG: SAM-dependent methyltransferase [Thermoanaerobaculia bacterium]
MYNLAADLQAPPAAADNTALRDIFRRLDPRDYPGVTDYSWNAIYGHGDNMAPGGLYLAERMTRSSNLEPGAVVLDVGCGKGDSSLFLARNFGVRVICFDLWTSSSLLTRKIERQGFASQVLPLDLDATERLPFADGYFDAIFCMQALHSFGGDAAVLRGLLEHLKPGGRFHVGGTCFDQEPADGKLPPIYSQTDGWDAEYSTYHSPSWWRELFLATGMVDVLECTELADGLVMWEDEILHHGESAGWTEAWHRNAKWLVDQVLFSRNHTPSLTHFVATLAKS